MSFILTAIGLLLLAISLAGVALGIYMAADRRTRSRGRLFAVMWVPGLAAASGILMRDVVTFMVGMLCFLVAGAVFVLEGDRPHEYPRTRRATWPEGRQAIDSSTPRNPPKENEAQGSGRVAS